ncbi:hypothetical protein, partial, partial [Parasitella parasitica]
MLEDFIFVVFTTYLLRAILPVNAASFLQDFGFYHILVLFVVIGCHDTTMQAIYYICVGWQRLVSFARRWRLLVPCLLKLLSRLASGADSCARSAFRWLSGFFSAAASTLARSGSRLLCGRGSSQLPSDFVDLTPFGKCHLAVCVTGPAIREHVWAGARPFAAGACPVMPWMGLDDFSSATAAGPLAKPFAAFRVVRPATAVSAVPYDSAFFRAATSRLPAPPFCMLPPSCPARTFAFAPAAVVPAPVPAPFAALVASPVAAPASAPGPSAACPAALAAGMVKPAPFSFFSAASRRAANDAGIWYGFSPAASVSGLAGFFSARPACGCACRTHIVGRGSCAHRPCATQGIVSRCLDPSRVSKPLPRPLAIRRLRRRAKFLLAERTANLAATKAAVARARTLNALAFGAPGSSLCPRLPAAVVTQPAFGFAWPARSADVGRSPAAFAWPHSGGSLVRAPAFRSSALRAIVSSSAALSVRCWGASEPSSGVAPQRAIGWSPSVFTRTLVVAAAADPSGVGALTA